MLVKQCSWRGNGIFLSIAALMSLQCFSADNQQFCDQSVRVLEHIYAAAPYDVHRIVNTLKSPNPKKPSWRNYAIFDGEPGVGKSLSGVAVAYKLNWNLQKFAVSDFMKVENRNGTSVVFNVIMSEFEKTAENTVVVVDEINQLLMNYDSKHHDTDASSKSLWTFLDGIEKKENIFFIGTTNGVGGFPPQIKDRINMRIFTIAPHTNPAYLGEILFNGLHDEAMLSDRAVSYLQENASLFINYSPRTLVNLIDKIQSKAEEAAIKNGSTVIVEPEHIEAALKDLADINARFQEKPYNETDVELRERHHRENKRQFWITLGVTATLGVATIVVTIYFSNRAHEQAKTLSEAASAAQDALHIDMKDHQQVMQTLLMNFQEELQKKALAAQAGLQQVAQAAQEKMHNEGMGLQKIGMGVSITNSIVAPIVIEYIKRWIWPPQCLFS